VFTVRQLIGRVDPAGGIRWLRLAKRTGQTSRDGGGAATNDVKPRGAADPVNRIPVAA
jgi:hypothetical protein